ncbi:hypothetical protein GCM10009591_32850 [Brachybacterium tyrofermentans]
MPDAILSRDLQEVKGYDKTLGAYPRGLYPPVNIRVGQVTPTGPRGPDRGGHHGRGSRSQITEAEAEVAMARHDTEPEDAATSCPHGRPPRGSRPASPAQHDEGRPHRRGTAPHGVHAAPTLRARATGRSATQRKSVRNGSA